MALTFEYMAAAALFYIRIKNMPEKKNSIKR